MLTLLLLILGGILVGFFPYFILSWMGRQDLAKKAFLCTAVSGVVGMSVFVAVGFIIYAILNRDNAGSSRAVVFPQASVAPTQPSNYLWKVTCIAGPLRGQTYTLGQNGLIIGRDYDCGIRLSANSANISRHHCSLRSDGTAVYLTDLGSRCGTYLSNGTRIYPQQPQPLQNGSVFYLANAENQFQIIY